MPKPVLPSHDSASYELLSLAALCGEFPCDSAARLISSESYRKKIVTGLTHNRLLRIFSRNHLRGYRLGIRGKRLLQDQEPERFLFYLSGCGDTNAIKSEPSRRLRLHRIARTYITMKNAGITIFRDKKPPLFSPDTAGAIPIEDVYFYDSREMKELRSEMLKIYGSRMTGALFTPKQAFAVFNAMDSIPTFDPQIERRAKVMLQRVCQIRTVATRKVDGMVDREAKRAEGKGVGYDRWAAKHNLKQMAATVTAYQQYGFSSPEELDEACSAAYTAMRESLTELKQVEKTLDGKKELQRQVLAYSKTRPVRDGLKQQKNAKAKAAYRQKYESDFIIADAAARYFRENGISKLPSYKALQAEIETLIQEKNSGYNDYRAKREEYRRLQTVKGNIDQILHRERKPVKRKEQER